MWFFVISHVALSFAQILFQAFQVCQHELGIDHLDVVNRINSMIWNGDYAHIRIDSAKWVILCRDLRMGQRVKKR